MLACTDDPVLNRQICRIFRDKGIPVNDCSDREDCDFLFPSVAVSGPIVAGVTSGGNDHAGMPGIRRKIEQAIGAREGLYEQSR